MAEVDKVHVIKSTGCNPIWRANCWCDVSVGKHYAESKDTRNGILLYIFLTVFRKLVQENIRSFAVVFKSLRLHHTVALSDWNKAFHFDCVINQDERFDGNTWKYFNILYIFIVGHKVFKSVYTSVEVHPHL